MKLTKRILAIALVLISLIVCMSSAFTVSAELSDSDKKDIQEQINKLNSQINDLEKQINAEKSKLNDQNKIKATYEKKISAINSKIIACNKYISLCQAEIDANEKKIADSNAKIEDTKERFKKRLRSIHNSNTDSGLQILMGAESFSDFLALAELTQRISAQDKKLIDEIVDTISEIEKDIAKNEELKKEQNEIKKTLAAEQDKWEVEAGKVQNVIDSINSTKANLEKDQAALERDMEDFENKLLGTSGGDNVPFDGVFSWPVPGFPMTTPWKSNDSIHKGNHKGVDLGSAGINGKSILSAASGEVIRVYNGCPHNYRKTVSQFCGCGGGYGNHVQVAHGKHNGIYYMTIYAHMSKTAVSNGAYVNRRQVLGYVGSTGRSTGPHLHFGIAKGTTPGSYTWFNPMSISYINR